MVSLCTAILAHAGAVGVSAQPLDPASSPTIDGLFLGGVPAFTGAFTGFIGLVAVSGMVDFWWRHFRGAHAYHVLCDLVLPLGAVAICGYTISSSITPAPPAPISCSAWILLASLVAGTAIVGVLLLTRPEAGKSFGRVFVGGHGEDGTTRQVLSAATGLPEVHRRG